MPLGSQLATRLGFCTIRADEVDCTGDRGSNEFCGARFGCRRRLLSSVP